jgi:hypothetical protein
VEPDDLLSFFETFYISDAKIAPKMAEYLTNQFLILNK